MTETSERQKNCVNICISKQRQRYHAFSQVEKRHRDVSNIRIGVYFEQ